MITRKMREFPCGSTVKVVWETEPQSLRGVLSNEYVYVVIGDKTLPRVCVFGKKAAQKVFNDLCALVAN